MSDSENFLLQIEVEELFEGDAASASDSASPKVKRRRTSSGKKKKKKMKIARLIPNHFIAFQIYDGVIRQKIADMQKKIVEKNPLLTKALIDVRTLHVTLAVTHLENEVKIKELQLLLQNWGESEMKKHFHEPMHLTFKGIGTFRKDVAFVKITECGNYRRLCNLSTAVNDLLSKNGFYSDGKTSFTPHLTLLKLSKNYKLFKDKKSVADDINGLNECDEDFGSQRVRDIQLLSMSAKKDDNGYYKCLWQMKTGDSEESQPFVTKVEDP